MDLHACLNPNHFGEVLRDQLFVRHNSKDLGGYTTFALLPEFSKLSVQDPLVTEIADIFVRIAASGGDRANLVSKTKYGKSYADDLEDTKHAIKVYSTSEYLVAWLWDDVGTLFFAIDGKAAINIDCKKDYGWQWVKW